jgi:transcriptional regulator with XRE-family HTH domain
MIMTIGTTIKALRRGRDLTQEELAEVLGVSAKAVSQWENDRTAPDLSQIPAICTYFDISADNSDDLLSHIEGYDYGGKSFIIVTTDGEYLESDNGDSLIAKAVSNRNGMVETKFNINIEVKVETANDIIENARTARSKGGHYADLIVAPANVLSQLMEEDCLINMSTIPYIDTNASYMKDSLVDSARINGKLYLLFGSFTQTEYSVWNVFYNKVVSERIGIDPYKLYKNGEWTWDKFLEYSNKAKSISENGFVSTATEGELVNALWATTGERFFDNCAWSEPELPKNAKGKEILLSIKKITESNSYGATSGTNALKLFTSGDSAMLLCRRNAVYEISESGMDWGAVPMPKYDSESTHCAYVDGEAFAASVPSSVKDTAFVGRVLNALLASTKDTVNESIKLNEIYYYWSNNKMSLMMEETKKYAHMDIAIIYAYAAKDIATVTTENIASSLDAGIAPFQFYHSTKNQFLLYVSEKFG